MSVLPSVSVIDSRAAVAAEPKAEQRVIDNREVRDFWAKDVPVCILRQFMVS